MILQPEASKTRKGNEAKSRAEERYLAGTKRTANSAFGSVRDCDFWSVEPIVRPHSWFAGELVTRNIADVVPLWRFRDHGDLSR